MNKNWSLAKMWNKALEQTEIRPVEPRDRIYASELGRSDIDIFLKMVGTEPTNPPNDRSHRKFHAGDLYEWFVFLVLKKCGILISKQLPVKNKMEGCVEVSGRLDYIAGGMPDYEKGQKEIDRLIELLEMPPLFKQITENFIGILKAEYPNGLDEKVLEVKSTAVHGFNRVEKTNKALAGHDLQNFHYAKGLDMEGALCYISRDDLRMYEIPILPNDQKLLERYKDKVKRVSSFYLANQMPDPEPPIIFDEDTFKFSKNFNVEYSPFLKKLYNIETPDEYDKMFKSRIASWNRVLGRVAKGDKMTPKNIEAINDMDKFGFNSVEIRAKVIANAPKVIEEEEEEI